MKKQFFVLVALVFAITSFGIDPSHAKRLRGFSLSKPAAAATPASAPKPAAAANPVRKEDAQASARPGLGPVFVLPRSNNSGTSKSASEPMYASDPMWTDDPLGAGDPRALSTASDATAEKPAAAPKKTEEPPAPPVQKHFVDLNPDRPKSQHKAGLPPSLRVTVCYATASGKCGKGG